MNKQKLLDQLRSGIITVKFKKISGAERVMKCTLSEKYLPKSKPAPVDAATKVKKDDVCVVWDTEAEGFRSFRYDSVIEVAA